MRCSCDGEWLSPSTDDPIYPFPPVPPVLGSMPFGLTPPASFFHALQPSLHFFPPPHPFFLLHSHLDELFTFSLSLGFSYPPPHSFSLSRNPLGDPTLPHSFLNNFDGSSPPGECSSPLLTFFFFSSPLMPFPLSLKRVAKFEPFLFVPCRKWIFSNSLFFCPTAVAFFDDRVWYGAQRFCPALCCPFVLCPLPLMRIPANPPRSFPHFDVPELCTPSIPIWGSLFLPLFFLLLLRRATGANGRPFVLVWLPLTVFSRSPHSPPGNFGSHSPPPVFFFPPLSLNTS